MEDDLLAKSSTLPNSVPMDASPKKLPKGVVLGKDGKPCRTCTSFASWASLTKSQPPSSSTSQPTNTDSSSSPSTSTSTTTSSPPLSSTPSPPTADCPADVESLGRSTWTLLHTLTATYPTTAPPTLQSKIRQFLTLFSELYPCWVCAEDFQDWMSKPENEPRVSGRSEFGLWMCRAHNEVNRKLGKKEFDCRLWEQRWRDGWADGRCD